MPRAEIATHQAKHTLQQLHAELAGKILDNKTEAERLRQAMQHVEAVLKMLDPMFDLRRIAIRRRKPNPWFKRGTVYRSAVDALREAGRPLTVPEVTAAMLRAKGVQEPAPDALRELEGAVRAALKGKLGIGIEAAGTNPLRWRLSESGSNQ